MADPLLELCERIESHYGPQCGEPQCVVCDPLRAARALRVLREGYLAHLADDCATDLCVYCGNAGMTAAIKAAEEE